MRMRTRSSSSRSKKPSPSLSSGSGKTSKSASRKLSFYKAQETSSHHSEGKPSRIPTFSKTPRKFVTTLEFVPTKVDESERSCAEVIRLLQKSKKMTKRGDIKTAAVQAMNNHIFSAITNELANESLRLVLEEMLSVDEVAAKESTVPPHGDTGDSDDEFEAEETFLGKTRTLLELLQNPRPDDLLLSTLPKHLEDWERSQRSFSEFPFASDDVRAHGSASCTRLRSYLQEMHLFLHPGETLAQLTVPQFFEALESYTNQASKDLDSGTDNCFAKQRTKVLNHLLKFLHQAIDRSRHSALQKLRTLSESVTTFVYNSQSGDGSYEKLLIKLYNDIFLFFEEEHQAKSDKEVQLERKPVTPSTSTEALNSEISEDARSGNTAKPQHQQAKPSTSATPTVMLPMDECQEIAQELGAKISALVPHLTPNSKLSDSQMRMQLGDIFNWWDFLVSGKHTRLFLEKLPRCQQKMSAVKTNFDSSFLDSGTSSSVKKVSSHSDLIHQLIDVVKTFCFYENQSAISELDNAETLVSSTDRILAHLYLHKVSQDSSALPVVVRKELQRLQQRLELRKTHSLIVYTLNLRLSFYSTRKFIDLNKIPTQNQLIAELLSLRNLVKGEEDPIMLNFTIDFSQFEKFSDNFKELLTVRSLNLNIPGNERVRKILSSGTVTTELRRIQHCCHCTINLQLQEGLGAKSRQIPFTTVFDEESGKASAALRMFENMLKQNRIPESIKHGLCHLTLKVNAQKFLVLQADKDEKVVVNF